MHFLRKSNGLIIFLTAIVLPACSTSSYKVIGQAHFRTEIQVTPDRVLLECEDIKDHENADDPDGSYGFMMHVFDEENTVLTLIREPVVDRVTCFKRLDEIAKILKNGKSIYIGGMGQLDKPREKGTRNYSTFPKPGTFYGNGRVLSFVVIQNEKSQCFNYFSGTGDPCLGDEFPIQKSPK